MRSSLDVVAVALSGVFPWLSGISFRSSSISTSLLASLLEIATAFFPFPGGANKVLYWKFLASEWEFVSFHFEFLL